MKTKISLITVMLLAVTCSLQAQETVFSTTFDYDQLPIVFEPADLNGAEGQIGEWSGPEFAEGIGDILVFDGVIDPAGIVPSPYGGDLFVVDRVSGDEDGNDFIGSYFADFTEPVALLGASVSFQVGTRRTGGNNEKDYDVVGRGSDGEESFRLRIGTNNNGGERLGFVTDGGETVVFDLPTVVGEDAGADLDNTGGFNAVDGPGFGAEIANVNLLLGPEGFTVDFFYPEEGTSGNANAYTTAQLPYNGPAIDLAQLEFTYEASTATGRNSGYILDEIVVNGFDEVLQGDFNFDGEVDDADYEIVRDNFLTGTSYAEGDFNFDGRVNLDDFAGLKEVVSQTAGAVVPEPSGQLMFLLLFGALAGFLRRSRKLRIAAICAVAASATSLHATDFDGRYINVAGDQINTTEEALGILRGTAAPRTIVEDVRGKVEFIDIGGGAGSFGDTVPYLNGVADTSVDDFLQQMTGLITIPAGDWTIGVGSDDGATVIIPGVTFDARFNATAGTSDDEVRFNGTRGHGWTMGEFTLDEPLTTQFEAVFFERGGGDSFEVAIIDELVGSNDPSGFEILGDGVLGWEVLDFTPGDFDLNGSVEFADFLTLASNFGTGTLYAEGDLNFSGRVDLADFVELRQVFESQPAGAAAVPEPSSAVLLQIAFLFGLTIIRRRAR